MGVCLEQLCDGQSVEDEIDHLVNTLKGTSVNYENLLWEPGLWAVGEKMQFIREVYWVKDSDQAKKSELTTISSSLGLLPFAVKISPNWTPSHLENDLKFLRDKIVAHQAGSYDSYTGPKEDIGTRKSTIEKSLRKEAPKYMLKFVEEIRALQWQLLSPLNRSRSANESWLKGMFLQAQPAPSVPAPGPAILVQPSSTQPTPSVPVPGTQSSSRIPRNTS